MTTDTLAPATRKRIDLRQARLAYARGENVTEHLRRQLGVDHNTSEVIEIAYDLQAGTYSEYTNVNRRSEEEYATGLAQTLDPHLRSGDSLLDVGTGEMTTLSLMSNCLSAELSSLLAFDISWSRLKHGLKFARANMKPQTFGRLSAFCADIKYVPLLPKSVDVIVSNHALEPNGGNEQFLLTELFRVVRRKLVLFEPDYARNCESGKRRMDQLRYVKHLDVVAQSLGGKVLDVVPLRYVHNELNPTSAYILEPPASNLEMRSSEVPFSDPGTDSTLARGHHYYFSPRHGVTYPVIDGIPVLRTTAAIVTTAMAEQHADPRDAT